MFKTGKITIEQALQNYHLVASPMVEKNQKIFIYPNPVKNELNIRNLTGRNQISVYSVNGEKCIDFATEDPQYQINTDFLKAGSYVLRVKKDNVIIFSGKIIKAR
jgi:hypothetical protein